MTRRSVPGRGATDGVRPVAGQPTELGGTDVGTTVAPGGASTLHASSAGRCFGLEHRLDDTETVAATESDDCCGSAPAAIAAVSEPER
ncbi:hypothetical protein [Natronorubrum bangense]|uniref:Uncharacterized protein n=1 Tax=Natronorubrum bangense JCM 10635 TaxID=1227500 RepID=L9WEY9_9EURY|nr:hypothetical protein [Natronorubrum bangense]ELY47851.1 hypothetical protein C494_11645 [Natronorubrum bangense JCM 10635]